MLASCPSKHGESECQPKGNLEGSVRRGETLARARRWAAPHRSRIERSRGGSRAMGGVSRGVGCYGDRCRRSDVAGRSRGERLWLRLGGDGRGATARRNREGRDRRLMIVRPNGARDLPGTGRKHAGAVSMPEEMEAAIIIGGPALDGAVRGAASTGLVRGCRSKGRHRAPAYADKAGRSGGRRARRRARRRVRPADP